MTTKKKDAIECPACNSKNTNAQNTAYDKRHNVRLRYRKCNDCGKAFYTLQEPEIVIEDQKVEWHQSWLKPGSGILTLKWK